MTALLVTVAATAAGLLGYWLGRRHHRSRAVEPATIAEPVRAAQDRPSRAPLDVERALADLRLGVVVVGPDGSEVYRNHRAQQYATGRHGNALVEAALERVLDGALLGLSLEESVEVYGPPARSFLVQASPTYADGVLDGAVGVIDDVTEARYIDRMRRDFVANVSHELRTPVGAMSVLAETIADSDDPEVVERLAGRMQREANRLNNTIHDLLALSRLESGPDDEFETIDLVSVATMAMQRTREAAQQRQVRISIENAADGPILVDGDRGQLVSAVANLIDNGIKYSDPGAEVVVRMRSLPTGTRPHGSAGEGRHAIHHPSAGHNDDWPTDTPVAELSVVDTGIGIPDRDLDRIFERFYRVDSARSRDTGGTGLGLSIVRHAVLNHRGTIEVDSIEGQGSSFTLLLPLSSAHGQLAPDRSGGARSADPDARGDEKAEPWTS